MAKRKRKHTQESLAPIVAECTSMSQVIRKHGLKVTGGSYRLFTQRIKEYEIDTSHFKGQGWSKDATKETNTSVKSAAKKLETPDEEVFTRNSGFNSSRLYSRLVRLGKKEKCDNPECGLRDWLGKPIRLHVDHINGDHADHRKENLQFLCPNCHQQTGTWGNKNRRKRV